MSNDGFKNGHNENYLDECSMAHFENFRTAFRKKFGTLILFMVGTGYSVDEIVKKGGVADNICLQIFQITGTFVASLDNNVIYREVMRLAREKAKQKPVKQSVSPAEEEQDLPEAVLNRADVHGRVGTLLDGIIGGPQGIGCADRKSAKSTARDQEAVKFDITEVKNTSETGISPYILTIIQDIDFADLEHQIVEQGGLAPFLGNVKEIILFRALGEAHDNIPAAARLAGLHRRSFFRTKKRLEKQPSRHTFPSDLVSTPRNDILTAVQAIHFPTLQAEITRNNGLSALLDRMKKSIIARAMAESNNVMAHVELRLGMSKGCLAKSRKRSAIKSG